MTLRFLRLDSTGAPRTHEAAPCRPTTGPRLAARWRNTSIAVALALACGAAAADAPKAEDAARCATIAGGSERLACYDGLFRQAAPEVVFGLERRNARSSEDLDTIRSRIRAVAQDRDGALVVTLENGQVWQQRDGKGQARWAVGDELVIERGALGSFMGATTGTSRYFRIRRAK
jgi:hypothetical protein